VNRIFRLALLATSVLGVAGPVYAQTAYPIRPVKIIVPFAPGGFTDVVARVLSQRLTQAMGQSFVVENKPGAGSIIGTNEVAKAPPDGYTLVIVSMTHTISPAIYKSLPYDPIKSFSPVSKLADSAYVLLVNPKVPVANVRELIALAKANPNKLHYASSGNGSAQHLMGGMFEAMAGVEMTHVPYRGSSGAAADLIAGVVESSFAGVPNALAYSPQGRLKALAVTTAKRVPQLPDVPTMQEAGVPGYDASVWLALLAPANTPPAIIDKLYGAIAKIIQSPDVRERILGMGADPALSTPAGFSAFIAAELKKWTKVIKDSGAKLD
jgi:tripartite-type tricarboxylate transporter receptor subunit TctC